MEPDQGRQGNENLTSPVVNNSQDIEKLRDETCECSKTKTDGMILEGMDEEEEEEEENAESVQMKSTDFVKRDVGNKSLELGDEKICRICHLGSESSTCSDRLIQLGCGCKEELGVSHLPCAQTWFKQKGNRLCEICGKTAINVSGVEDVDSVILLVEWDEMRLMAAAAASAAASPSLLRRGGGGGGDTSDQCKRTFRNIVMACLVLAFVVPWFFRINMF